MKPDPSLAHSSSRLAFLSLTYNREEELVQLATLK